MNAASSKSVIRVRNDFSERSSFANILSFRCMMTYLSNLELSYPNLENMDEADIANFFKARDLEDSNFLRTFISIEDFVEIWTSSSQQKFKTRKSVKDAISKKILSTVYVSESENEHINVFSDIKEVEDGLIAAWFNPKIMPHLVNPHLAQSGYVSSQLWWFQPIRSVSTAKLFKQMLRFKDTGLLHMTVSKIVELTQTSSNDFGAINRNVIQRISKELVDLGYITKSGITVINKRKANSFGKVSSFSLKFQLAKLIVPAGASDEKHVSDERPS